MSQSTPKCGCRVTGEIADPERHAAWHESIKPLTRADYTTLVTTYGRPDVPKRTYIDAQFDRARGKRAVEPH